MAAGHSLGELGALAAAGVLDADDALRLVVAARPPDGRGRRLRLDARPARRRRSRTPRRSPQAAGVTVANDNAPGQVVLSGERGALEEAEEAAARVQRPRPRRSTSPARSTRPAWSRPSRRSARRWTRSSSSTPRFPVYCGATAAPFDDVRGELAEALIRPVRWRETFLALLDAGAEDFVETGPGTVLSKMARRITKETANA